MFDDMQDDDEPAGDLGAFMSQVRRRRRRRALAQSSAALVVIALLATMTAEVRGSREGSETLGPAAPWPTPSASPAAQPTPKQSVTVVSPSTPLRASRPAPSGSPSGQPTTPPAAVDPSGQLDLDVSFLAAQVGPGEEVKGKIVLRNKGDGPLTLSTNDVCLSGYVQVELEALDVTTYSECPASRVLGPDETRQVSFSGVVRGTVPDRRLTVTARAMFDQGSQRGLIRTSTAEKAVTVPTTRVFTLRNDTSVPQGLMCLPGCGRDSLDPYGREVAVGEQARFTIYVHPGQALVLKLSTAPFTDSNRVETCLYLDAATEDSTVLASQAGSCANG